MRHRKIHYSVSFAPFFPFYFTSGPPKIISIPLSVCFVEEGKFVNKSPSVFLQQISLTVLECDLAEAVIYREAGGFKGLS